MALLTTPPAAGALPVASSPGSGLKVGRYQLLARLGEGGMGEVFIARHTGVGDFEKRVALKLMLPHLLAPEFVEMFLDEVRIAARMEHPNIVPVFDAGAEAGRYYLAMALVEGVSLHRLLRAFRRSGRLVPLPVVRLLAMGLAEALDYAHHLKGAQGEPEGIVHRDVNPSNVLVSSTGAVLLNDFGVAKAKNRVQQTRSGQVKGKYAYMPPEQLEGKGPIDARVDVFALAVTLHEVLALSSPFLRETEVATIDAIRTEPLPELVRTDVPASMRAALAQGAAKPLDERFASARALLEAFLHDGGPIARPAELGQWVRELCAAELAVFSGAGAGTPAAPAVQGPVTQALPESGVVEPESGPPTRSERPGSSGQGDQARPRLTNARWFASMAAVVAVVVGAAWAVWAGWLRSSPSPAGSAPVAAAPARAVTSESAPATSTPGSSSIPSSASFAPAAPSPAPAGAALERVSSSGDSRPPEPPTGGAPGALSPPTGVASPSGVEPATARLAGTGYLSVDAEPWAEVWVRGKLLERTPVSRYPLPAGRYVVELKNPALGKSERRRVVVMPGKVSAVRADFRAPATPPAE